jgi:hypothetical protein
MHPQSLTQSGICLQIWANGKNYFIDGIFWGDDEEGVILYLRAKGVSPDDITKALAEVAQVGRYLIQQEEVTQPVL